MALLSFCVLVLLDLGSSRSVLPEKIYHYTDLDGAEKIRQTGVLKGSTKFTGHAKFGDGVYATSIDPEHRKKAILDNNYGRESRTNVKKADVVVELDVPSMQRLGYTVEQVKTSRAGGRDVYRITKGSSIHVELSEVDNRILAKADWLTQPRITKTVELDDSSNVRSRTLTDDGGILDSTFNAAGAKWKVLACVGRTCGQVQGHWLEWKSASSYYRFEKWDNGWRSTSVQNSEHGVRHTVEAKDCTFGWLCAKAPSSRSMLTQERKGTIVEETGQFFKTQKHTVDKVVRTRSCNDDVCSLHKGQNIVSDTKSEGLFIDRHRIKETTCTNDVCSIKHAKHNALAAPAKAGIGATVSSALTCTGQHLRKNEATFGSWAEECIPAAFMSGGIGLAIGVISKVPLVGPAVPLVLQASGIVDACTDAVERCACELGRTLAIVGPTMTLGALVPGGWLGTSILSGVIGGALPQCSN